jgi:hypothetical protein
MRLHHAQFSAHSLSPPELGSKQKPPPERDRLAALELNLGTGGRDTRGPTGGDRRDRLGSPWLLVQHEDAARALATGRHRPDAR